jgi:chorismate synthase
MGAVIDGCPAGVLWRQDLMDHFLQRRRPGQNDLTSARAEPDQVRILSGVYEDKTLGTPIAAVIFNQDARSADYSAGMLATRPGHATDLWQSKFQHSDPRGSGRASGRVTVSRVIAGSVAQMLVQQLFPAVRVFGFVSGIGTIQLSDKELEGVFRQYDGSLNVDSFSLRCPIIDKNSLMEDLLKSAKNAGESHGGIATVRISGVPAGWGEPVFYKLKSLLSNAYMSIGATMGVEFGAGFAAASRSGAEFHDPLHSTRNYGGLRGGISTGEPITARVAFKPTSSRREAALTGRHDPCIVPRAVPVLESMTWLVLADQLLLNRGNKV